MRGGSFLRALPENVKAAWVKALRSGEFAQGTGALCNPGHAGDPDEFCCLGVLARVLNLVIKNGQGLIYARDLNERGITGFTRELGGALGAQLEFSSLNDEYGWSFERIADYIEGKVEHPDPECYTP